MNNEDNIELKRDGRRTRRLAWQFLREEDRRRAMAFAVALESQADALEQTLAPKGHICAPNKIT